MIDSMKLGLGERSVTVNRLKLIDALRKNRETHQVEYKAAVSGYKEMARAKLVASLTKARAALADNFDLLQKKIDRCDPEDDDAVSDHVTLINAVSFTLKVPQDHTKSYDVAIQMAEWEVNENVELTQGQFQCFVLDDWDWRDEFRATTKMYGSRG